MAGEQAYGPMDFVIIEFPADASGDRTAAALRELVDRRVLRLYDLVVIRKPGDGPAEEIDLAREDTLAALQPFSGARSGLLGREDLQAAGDALDPGKVAVIIVYENTWAAPFVAAARAEGAELVASARLSAQQIMDAVEALEVVS